MKVTAILPDDLISEVKRYSKGENTTESLLMALREWLALRRIKELNGKVEKEPLQFDPTFSAELTRKINRES